MINVMYRSKHLSTAAHVLPKSCQIATFGRRGHDSWTEVLPGVVSFGEEGYRPLLDRESEGNVSCSIEYTDW